MIGCFIILLSVLLCHGLLLDNTPSGSPRDGQVMTMAHYQLLQNILSVQKQKFTDMETLVLQLQSELKSVKQEVSNRDAVDIRFINELKNETSGLQQTITSLTNNFQNKVQDLQTELKQVKNENQALKHDVITIKQENTILKGNMSNCCNGTMLLKHKLNEFINKTLPSNVQNMTMLHGIIDSLKGNVTLQCNSSKTEIQLLARRQVQIEDDIKDMRKEITDMNKSVALTSCAPAGRPYHYGDTITFPIVRTAYGISDVASFQTSGVFLCETPGIYLFSVFIGVESDNVAEIVLHKSGQYLAGVLIHDGNHHWSSSSATIAVHLNVGDTLYVRASQKQFFVDSEHACFTVIKIR